MALTRLQKNGINPESYDRNSQLALERADREFGNGNFVQQDAQGNWRGGSDDDVGEFYFKAVTRRAAQLGAKFDLPESRQVETAYTASRVQSGRSPGRVTVYDDGTSLVDVPADVVAADAEQRERQRSDWQRKPGDHFAPDFVPYGATTGNAKGEGLRGPELAEYVDPRGQTYGDPRFHPGAREREREKVRQQNLVRRKGQSESGVVDYMPAAEMDNRGNNLKFTNERAPTMESGARMYGNPKSFPGRDSWRGRFTGGFSAGPAGRTYKGG